MRDRVFAPSEKRWIFNKLKRSSVENPDGIFESNKDILVFCASIGFKRNMPREFNRDSKNDVEILLLRFTKEDHAFIDTIALASTFNNTDPESGNVNLFSWEKDDMVEQKLLIFEQYVNGGLEILDKELFQNNTSIFDNLLQLINKELKTTESEKEIIDLKNLVVEMI